MSPAEAWARIETAAAADFAFHADDARIEAGDLPDVRAARLARTVANAATAPTPTWRPRAPVNSTAGRAEGA
ncbi:hypothetical protein [Embleya sp. NPDC050493]|uniref:hypothetical protein n=1 Tax=Embleya sp. NPDC050493 TaxID=3363989 RepID=UPI0037AC89F3